MDGTDGIALALPWDVPAETPKKKLTRTRALIAATLVTLGGLVWLAGAAQPMPQGALADSADVASSN